MTTSQSKLFELVKQYHGDQKRKYTGEPYYTHVFNVVEMVGKYVPNTYEIALCHDLFEDTICTPEMLREDLKQCGYSVGYATSIVSGVKNLTDVYTTERYPDMNRKERKTMEAYRLGTMGSSCQSIKYADLIDNTRSIVKDDPGFARIYLPEAVELLNRMRKGDIHLFIQCAYEIQSGVRTKEGSVAQENRAHNLDVVRSGVRNN